MLRFPKPAELNGTQLEAELLADGYSSAMVYVAGEELVVVATTTSGTPIDHRSTARVARLVANHRPAAPPAEPPRAARLDELAAIGDHMTAEQHREFTLLLYAELRALHPRP